MKPLAVVLVALMALDSIACDNDIARGVGVDNRTDTELHFQVQLEGPSWYSPPEVAPAHGRSLVIPASVIPRRGCTFGAMVALDPDGAEVARHVEPVCVGDVWVIE